MTKTIKQITISGVVDSVKRHKKSHFSDRFTLK